MLALGVGGRRGWGRCVAASAVVRRVASGDFVEVQVLLGAVAREQLPDGADVAVIGKDEALARAGFGGTGLADFGVAGLAGPNKYRAAADPKGNLLPTPAGSDPHGI